MVANLEGKRLDLRLSEASTNDDEHVDSQKHVDDSSYGKDGRCIL